jgi:DNA-binding GntR family transcriptional regulator
VNMMKATITSEMLNEKAYKRLKQAIFQSELPPGTRVFDSHIAEMFGISRTPVRDAIKMLINEGLIVNKGKSGNFILDVSEKDINELYDLRLLLEKYTIESFAKEGSSFCSDAAIAVLDKYDKNAPDYTEQFVRFDEEFHKLMVSFTSNQRLCKVYSDVIDQTKVFRKKQAVNHAKVGVAMQEHCKMVYASKEKEYDEAVAVISKHIELARYQALKFFESEE